MPSWESSILPRPCDATMAWGGPSSVNTRMNWHIVVAGDISLGRGKIIACNLSALGLGSLRHRPHAWDRATCMCGFGVAEALSSSWPLLSFTAHLASGPLGPWWSSRPWREQLSVRTYVPSSLPLGWASIEPSDLKLLSCWSSILCAPGRLLFLPFWLAGAFQFVQGVFPKCDFLTVLIVTV